MLTDNNHKEPWFWPAVVGFCLGGSAGFLSFSAGLGFQHLSPRTIEILTSAGTVLGGLGAAAAAWISYYSAKESAMAAEKSAQSLRSLSEVEQKKYLLSLTPDCSASIELSIDQVDKLEEPSFWFMLNGPEPAVDLLVYTTFRFPFTQAVSMGEIVAQDAQLECGEKRVFSLQDSLTRAYHTALASPSRGLMTPVIALGVEATISFAFDMRGPRFLKRYYFVFRYSDRGWALGQFDESSYRKGLNADSQADFESCALIVSLGRFKYETVPHWASRNPSSPQ